MKPYQQAILILAVVAGGYTVSLAAPRGTPPEPPAPAAGPLSVAAAIEAADAEVAQKVARLSARLDCAAPGRWKLDADARPAFPARMLVKIDGTTEVRAVPWTYPPAPDQWVLALCSR